MFCHFELIHNKQIYKLKGNVNESNFLDLEPGIAFEPQKNV